MSYNKQAGCLYASKLYEKNIPISNKSNLINSAKSIVCQFSCSIFIEITCPAPNRGANSKKPPSDIRDGMTYLETYTYECKKGFTTDVEDRCTVCLPNGTLSLPDGPDCAGKF